MTLKERVTFRARQLFVERHRPSLVREIAALNGAYDQGTDITQYMEEAELDVLRAPAEEIDE